MVFQLHLGSETVGQMDLPSPLCLAPSASLREVLQLLQAERRGSVLICREEQIVGIFTERDALLQMARGTDLEQLQVVLGEIAEAIDGHDLTHRPAMLIRLSSISDVTWISRPAAAKPSRIRANTQITSAVCA